MGRRSIKPKISHHKHSGRRLPRQHTSYGLLGVLMLIAGVVLFITSRVVFALDEGTITVTGVVPGPPPTQGAHIIEPKTGDRFSRPEIRVSGTCPENTIVSVYSNNNLRGSTLCQPNLTFSLRITLFLGRNVLIAKVEDEFGQTGPDSNVVTVLYVPEGPEAPTDVPGGQPGTPAEPGEGTPSRPPLIIYPLSSHSGANRAEFLKTGFGIHGGKRPYALSIEWGDRKSDLQAYAKAGEFETGHNYSEAGHYEIIFYLKDEAGNSAIAQTVALVTGKNAFLPLAAAGIDLRPLLMILWPLLGISAIAVGAFWLGEERELDLLESQPKHG